MSVRSWLCSLVLLCVLHSPRSTSAVELTFELPDNAKECFFEVIEKDTEATLEFQVSKRLGVTEIESSSLNWAQPSWFVSQGVRFEEDHSVLGRQFNHVPRPKPPVFVPQVVTGGQYDVDVVLTDPRNNVLYKQVKKQYDSHAFKVKQDHSFHNNYNI